MNRRSLTLLETLIALVLVLAVGALVFPSLLNSMQERTFESTADTTNQQLMMARAHAQATGAPVEVTYRADTSQVQARMFVPWLSGVPASPMRSMGTSGEKQAKFEPLESAESDSPDTHRTLIGEAWACRALGPGVWLTSRPPAAQAQFTIDSAFDTDQMEYEPLEELGKGQDIRLAVFMPDGSALLAEPVWLNDDDGRCGRLSINPWSGLPIFQRLADLNDQMREISADDTELKNHRRAGWSIVDGRASEGKSSKSGSPQSDADDETIGGR